ncbi:MAG: NEW3 domain-containing protein [Armatimonadota bacterium]|nr:NEW3 domain-containing protein [Armatimonadota bacterium]
MSRFAILLVVAGLVLAQVPSGPATAGPSPTPTPGYRGLALTTPFPDQTIRQGEPVTLSLTVRNYGLPPQVVALSASQRSAGWKVTFLGAGRPVGAVSVGTDQEASLSVRLDPPQRPRAGVHRFTLVARGQDAEATLPVSLIFGEVLPPRLGLSAELPTLRGPGTSSFRYRLTLKNESDQDLLVNLEAQAARGFQVTFTPAFGSQQVTSLPVKAGESKDLDAEVSLPQGVAAGTYDVTVRASGGGAQATVKLTLEVVGRPDLSVTTPDGRLSGRAYAGRETPIKLVVENRGSAPARNVEMSSFEPTGWKVTFDPKQIDEIPPRGKKEVTATILPAAKAIAGDYNLTLRAGTGDTTSSAEFRVTVYTSTLWGVVGVAIVAVALGVLGLAVSRYGRR